VPALLRTEEGELIATFQYFSYEREDEFGFMAYSTSEDGGESWTAPQVIDVSGLPLLAGDSKAVDPALVQLADGDLRLYFTVHAQGDPHTHVAAARASSITATFNYEGSVYRRDDTNLLDPTVIQLADTWHYYTPAPGGRGVLNHHGTSADGLTFEMESDIAIEMNMLGNPLAVDGGVRFYGSGPDGVLSAFSSDGFEWTLDEGHRAPGRDPAVAEPEEGSFILIYTAPPPMP
jgi:hypothetical protein